MRVPGIYYNSLGAWTPLVLDDAGVVGTQLIAVTGAAASYPVFNTSGAPYSTLALGLEFVMAAAGVPGQTIQLQTAAGVACTEVINLAATAQWGINFNQTLLYPVSIIGPAGNFNLVTTGLPVGLAVVTLVRVNA
jgi:hypothetical protein